MGTATENPGKPAPLPEGDVVRILLEQHAHVRELFRELTATRGEQRQAVFDELRTLLAVHETAEELVLRPVSQKVAGQAVSDARNEEERQANIVLAELEKLDVTSAEFEAKLATFQTMVEAHAENEEREEFPAVVEKCDAAERHSLGERLRTVESLAPTRAHPSAAGSITRQLAMGPIASVVDRVRDALSGHGSDRR